VLLRQHLLRDGETSPLFAALHDQRLARAVVAVLDDPAAAHTLESLARRAGMSRTAFAERFSQVFGQGPIDFVQKVRLRIAAKLLATTDVPVKVIATSIGYASRSYFSRAFRAAYGTDPTSFRASAGGQERLSPPASVADPPQ
jgi:transcriptional regulator GlxA family with amidase domain